MGVYINMEMPKSCYVCPFCDYVSARCDAVKGNPYTPDSRYEKRADFCPLVPVPPHGDLIENSVIKKAINDACAECKESCIEFDGFFADCNQCIFHDVKKALVDAFTIIPAEEGET